MKHNLLFQKVFLFIIALFLTILTGLMIYFALVILFAIYEYYTKANPESGTMPAGALIYALFPTIILSIFILIKFYKKLIKKYT